MRERELEKWGLVGMLSGIIFIIVASPWRGSISTVVLVVGVIIFIICSWVYVLSRNPVKR